MKRLSSALPFAFLCIAACSSSSGGNGPGGGSSGGSGSSSSGGSSSSSSGGQPPEDSGLPTDGSTAQYDTLSGTVSASGASAVFSGAMEMDDIPQGGETAYYATSSFASVGLPTTQFGGDAGGTLVGLSISLGKTAGPPAATTITCSEAMGGASISFGWTSSDGKAHSVGASPGVTGSSCTVSFQAPTFVTANSEGEWYFAHGSLSGTLVSEPEDGGVETGSISATW